MTVYTTVQGQTWDMIAREVYGEEKYAGFLMASNLRHLDFFIFPSGIVLNTPELPQETGNLPSWRVDND